MKSLFSSGVFWIAVIYGTPVIIALLLPRPAMSKVLRIKNRMDEPGERMAARAGILMLWLFLLAVLLAICLLALMFPTLGFAILAMLALAVLYWFFAPFRQAAKNYSRRARYF
jgi:hypothetical protein